MRRVYNEQANGCCGCLRRCCRPRGACGVVLDPRRQGGVAGNGGDRPLPHPSRADQNRYPDRPHRSCKGLAGGRSTEGGARSRGQRVRDRSYPPTLALRAAERRCPRRRIGWPAAAGGGKGRQGFIYRMVQKRAGAGTPSANRITLLRDSNASGIATMTVFLEDLNSPFGMALVGNDLYVANTDAILRFPYTEGATQISDPGVKVADLPGGPINHHWTKNLSRAATDRGFTRPSAPTATPEKMGSTRRKAARRSSRSIAPAANREYSRRAFAISTAWIGSRRPARSGRW